MAANTTQLSDVVIVPEIVSGNIILRSLATNAFYQSGVAVRDPLLDAFLDNEMGGKTISPRYLGPVVDDDPNISSDDPAVLSVPKKITGFKTTAVRQSYNQSWSVMDLTADYSGFDPLGAITDQIGGYWDRRATRIILASTKGAVSGAESSSDMVIDVSGETGAAALFNPDAFIDAKTTMGDRASTLTAMSVHSHVYATMQKLNVIDFVEGSDAKTLIPTYQGIRVIVDDAMPVIPQTSGENGTPKKYYTYLFGQGAVALGVGSPKVPFEYERKPASGNGGGEELVYSRTEWIIHPQGYSFGLDHTPTIAELETASNWTRKFERKRIPLAVLITQ